MRKAELQVTEKVLFSLEGGFKVLSGIFAALKLYKLHTEGSEGSRSNVNILVSGHTQCQ